MAASEGRGLAEHLAELARDMEAPESLDETLSVIVRAAVDHIPGAEHASISTVERRQFVHTLAASSDLARAADRAQLDAKEGPCLETLYEDRTVGAPDLARDERWPRFAERGAELGIASMLAVQLYANGDDLGALNLLNGRPHAFGDDSEEMALLFATHAAIALAHAERRENLSVALTSRDVIGQAKGILMERHRITADQAFRLLVRASQARHRKLRDIAEELTTTGELPGTPRR